MLYAKKQTKKMAQTQTLLEPVGFRLQIRTLPTLQGRFRQGYVCSLVLSVHQNNLRIAS